MEQSVLSIDQQRWVNAITTLTTKTYQGKMDWQKNSSQPISDFATQMAGLPPPLRYTHQNTDGIKFVVVVRDNALRYQTLLDPGFSSGESVTFEVWKGSKKIFSVSNLSVLSVLADAISSQVEQYEEEALSAIESLNA